MIKKEAKKILKYKDLATEIQVMWNVNIQVGATGTNPKSHKTAQQRTGKARNRRTGENSHIRCSTLTSESTAVHVQNI
jgi:hypothetical protein